MEQFIKIVSSLNLGNAKTVSFELRKYIKTIELYVDYFVVGDLRDFQSATINFYYSPFSVQSARGLILKPEYS